MWLKNYSVLAPYVNKENSGTVQLKLKKQKIFMKSPKYLGTTILDISKMLMRELFMVYIFSTKS